MCVYIAAAGLYQRLPAIHSHISCRYVLLNYIILSNWSRNRAGEVIRSSIIIIIFILLCEYCNNTLSNDFIIDVLHNILYYYRYNIIILFLHDRVYLKAKKIRFYPIYFIVSVCASRVVRIGLSIYRLRIT